MNKKLIITKDFSELKKLGYSFSIMEGGWISPSGATYISELRRPYIRKVKLVSHFREEDYKQDLSELENSGLIEDDVCTAYTVSKEVEGMKLYYNFRTKKFVKKPFKEMFTTNYNNALEVAYNLNVKGTNAEIVEEKFSFGG